MAAEGLRGPLVLEPYGAGVAPYRVVWTWSLALCNLHVPGALAARSPPGTFRYFHMWWGEMATCAVACCRSPTAQRAAWKQLHAHNDPARARSGQHRRTDEGRESLRSWARG